MDEDLAKEPRSREPAGISGHSAAVDVFKQVANDGLCGIARKTRPQQAFSEAAGGEAFRGVHRTPRMDSRPAASRVTVCTERFTAATPARSTLKKRLGRPPRTGVGSP
jgi:hypothetical protein